MSIPVVPFSRTLMYSALSALETCLLISASFSFSACCAPINARLRLRRRPGVDQGEVFGLRCSGAGLGLILRTGFRTVFSFSVMPFILSTLFCDA